MTEIPQASKSRNSKWGKIFKQCLNQGDNFFIPFEAKSVNGFSPIVSYFNKKLSPMNFVIRTKDINGNQETCDGKEGFRVWRAK
jgi:hypothetical protein